MLRIYHKEGLEVGAIAGERYNVMGVRVQAEIGTCGPACAFYGEEQMRRCLFAPDCEHGIIYIKEAPNEKA